MLTPPAAVTFIVDVRDNDTRRTLLLAVGGGGGSELAVFREEYLESFVSTRPSSVMNMAGKQGLFGGELGMGPEGLLLAGAGPVVGVWAGLGDAAGDGAVLLGG